MRQFSIYDVCLLAGLAAGCSTTDTSVAGGTPYGEEAKVQLAAALGSEAVESEQVSAAEAAADRAFFNGRAFREQMRNTALPLTDVEPERTEADLEAEVAIAESMSQERWGDAANILAEYVSEDSSARLDYLFGFLMVRQERFEDAVPAFRTAVEKHPNYVNAWQQVGQLHYRAGNHGDAVTAFSRVIALGHANATTYGLLGVSHAKVGDFVSAESAFRMATMLDPTTIDWKMGLGESLARQRRYADAASLYGGLLTEMPDRAELWLAQGEAMVRLGEPLQAAQNFEMAERLGGASEGVLYTLGDIYSNEKLYDLAIGAYGRAMQKNPAASPERALRAAKFLSGSGAPEAVELLDAIEATFGERLDVGDKKAVLATRARLAFRAGASDEEAELLKEIVALDPTDGDALLELGNHALRQEDLALATTYFERAEGIDAAAPDALVGLARVLVKQRNYGDALPLLKRAQSLNERASVEEFFDRVERAARGR